MDALSFKFEAPAYAFDERDMGGCEAFRQSARAAGEMGMAMEFSAPVRRLVQGGPVAGECAVHKPGVR
jgi:hypothetical protein